MSLRQTEDGAPVAAKHLNDAECWEQYFQHYRDYSVRSWAVICATGRLKVHTVLPVSRGAECCFGIRG